MPVSGLSETKPNGTPAPGTVLPPPSAPTNGSACFNGSTAWATTGPAASRASPIRTPRIIGSRLSAIELGVGIEGHGGDDDQADHHLLDVGGDVHDDEAVGQDADQQGADQGAADAALPARQAGPADDDRG